MNIIIVGHKDRIDWIIKLQRALPGAAAIVDYADEGAAAGHYKALQIASSMTDRAIIIEDDAIPVVDFHAKARAWFDRFPAEAISFYLGTGRPQRWQPIVEAKLRMTELDHIIVPKLLHAVCYSIPARGVTGVLARMRRREADFAIGSAWGRPIYYPVESLVEHRDGRPVEKHPDRQPRKERRVARKLAGPLMYAGDDNGDNL